MVGLDDLRRLDDDSLTERPASSNAAHGAVDALNELLIRFTRKREKSLSTDSGFSFLGSIQEVIKFRE